MRLIQYLYSWWRVIVESPWEHAAKSKRKRSRIWRHSCSFSCTRWVTQSTFFPYWQKCDNTYEMCCLGKPFSHSVPRVFAGGWSHRHPLPISYQNCRFPEKTWRHLAYIPLFAKYRDTEPYFSVSCFLESFREPSFSDAGQWLIWHRPL